MTTVQAVWPRLTFYLSVLVALGVGALALATGNSPVLVTLKTGAALLVFSIVGWMLNVIWLIAGTSSAARPTSLQPGDNPDSDDK